MKRKFISAFVLVIAVVSLFQYTGLAAYVAQYTYDAGDRLITASSKEHGETSYQYDAAGNILRVSTAQTAAGILINGDFSGEVLPTGTGQGWNSYATEGITAAYQVVAEPITLAVIPEIPGGVTQSVYQAVYQPASPYSQMIQVSSSQAGGANIYQDISVLGGATYSLSGWMKAEILSNAAAQMVVNFYDKDNKYVSHTVARNMLTPEDWSHVQTELKVPEHAVKARLHLQVLLLGDNGSALAKYSNVAVQLLATP
ncbi:RHS repeat protein [Paenibacillus sp. SC116]|uniref:RHS repeat domain-containing protein n=1 Tax=Paenibacillus sp. SC116 TaxID=2968986 RepID=UPI00215A5443|nr:RHS repeat domain-containing protein [Paenibacillus sp. SC116]MCR8845336.1 RHS repeat protein [Paenibacillus sp. SC116]